MKFFVAILFVFFVSNCFSKITIDDNIVLVYSNKQISLEEEFCITLSVEGERLKQMSSFPEINDFEKTNTIYQKEKKKYVVKQYYRPRIKGSFEVEDFSLIVNNVKHSFKGANLKVVDSRNKKEIFPKPNPEVSYEESNPMCELVVKINKNTLYYSESCSISIFFRILEDNKAELNFIDLQNQLKSIANQIRQNNIWVHDLTSLKELTKDTSNRFNRLNPTYILYKGYISTLDTGTITIPSLNFNILKYNVFNSAVEVKRKAVVYNIKSKPILIQSLTLPSALENKWIAGQFKMDDHISSEPYFNKKAFYYTINISTEGVSGTIPDPVIIPNEKFNIFTPKITDQFIKIGGREIGIKVFKYTIIPQQEGQMVLSDYFYWTYFNTLKNKIDTLKPFKTIIIQANNNTITELTASNTESWENLINNSSAKIYHLELDPKLRWIANALILIMLVITIFIIFKK